MIDIVIPFCPGKNDSVELRFALRSIEKHLSGVQDVWIIGEPPVWIRNVKVLSYGDSPRAQDHEKNIFDKLMLAYNCEDISETFIMAHDDHILLRDYIAPDFPYYSHRTLLQGAQANSGSYRTTLIHTEKLLRRMLLPTFDFDCHCPIVFNKQRFKDAFFNVVWKDYGFAVKSLYCNYHEIEAVPCVDLKLSGRKLRDIQQAIIGREWFSTGSSNETIQVFLSGLLPHKSRFEA